MSSTILESDALEMRAGVVSVLGDPIRPWDQAVIAGRVPTVSELAGLLGTGA